MRRSQPFYALLGTALAIASLGGAGGCTFINAYEDPPIVGKWQGTAESRPDARMKPTLDGGGSATLSAKFEGDATASTNGFKLEWEQQGSNDYDIDFKCTSSTHPAGTCVMPFTLRCTISVSADKLSCIDKSGVWTTSDFHWQAD